MLSVTTVLDLDLHIANQAIESMAEKTNPWNYPATEKILMITMSFVVPMGLIQPGQRAIAITWNAHDR